jgi:hypothetical protein
MVEKTILIKKEIVNNCQIVKMNNNNNNNLIYLIFFL